MNRTPALSVVLPTYNGIAFIRDSIESVLQQDGEPFELIICDDASSDGTWEVLQEYSSRCRILRNETNRGLFPTLNHLITETRSQWIHLWAQDDRMLPGCIKQTCAFAREHPEVGMIYSRMYFIDESGRRLSKGDEDDPTPSVVNSLLAAQIMYYFGSITGNISNVTLNRSAFDEVGPFREDLKVSGDYEYWTRLSERRSIGFQRERLLELREHGGQFSMQQGSGVLFIRENVEIYHRLFKRLPESERDRAVRFHRWVIQPNSLHLAIKSLVRGKWNAFADIIRILRSETSVFTLTLRWLLKVNGHLVRRPNLLE